MLFIGRYSRMFPTTTEGENAILVFPKSTNSPSIDATKSTFLLLLNATFGRALNFGPILFQHRFPLPFYSCSHYLFAKVFRYRSSLRKAPIDPCTTYSIGWY